MIDEQRLAEIEERCNKATPGEWEYGSHHTKNIFPAHYLIGQCGEMYDHAIILSAHDGGEGKANAEFVAHSRQDVPDLLLHIREQAAELERLREILKDMKSCDNCKHAFWKEYGFVCMRNFRNCKNNNMGHHEYNEPQSEVQG